MKDGITAAQLLTSRELAELKRKFLDDCHARGVEPTRRQAKKWLERNNLRYLKAA